MGLSGAIVERPLYTLSGGQRSRVGSTPPSPPPQFDRGQTQQSSRGVGPTPPLPLLLARSVVASPRAGPGPGRGAQPPARGFGGGAGPGRGGVRLEIPGL